MLNWRSVVVCLSTNINVTARLALYDAATGLLLDHQVNEEAVERTRESGPFVLFEHGSGGKCKEMSLSLSFLPQGLGQLVRLLGHPGLLYSLIDTFVHFWLTRVWYF